MECCSLYLASGVVLAVITALEVRKYLWDMCCIVRECEFFQMLLYSKVWSIVLNSWSPKSINHIGKILYSIKRRKPIHKNIS
jgi:hypothetical protein